MRPSPSRIAAQTWVGIQPQTLTAKRQPKYRPGEDLLGRVIGVVHGHFRHRENVRSDRFAPAPLRHLTFWSRRTLALPARGPAATRGFGGHARCRLLRCSNSSALLRALPSGSSDRGSYCFMQRRKYRRICRLMREDLDCYTPLCRWASKCRSAPSPWSGWAATPIFGKTNPAWFTVTRMVGSNRTPSSDVRRMERRFGPGPTMERARQALTCAQAKRNTAAATAHVQRPWGSPSA